MSRGFTGGALVAGVVGRPIAHSLSPLIHNTWIAAAGLDAAYVPFSPDEAGPGEDRFGTLIAGLRAGGVRGVNVTLPFKTRALALADHADGAAQGAGAANLLIFRDNGVVEARNTDGLGLLHALAVQAPKVDLTARPVVVVGAGGAARGAVAALLAHGCPQVRIINRTRARATGLAARVGGVAVDTSDPQAVKAAFRDVAAVINATSAGLDGADHVALDLSPVPKDAALMDMVYKPLLTPFLRQAGGRTMVDGLEMLIGQAQPSFEALFGIPPPDIDLRPALVRALEANP